MLFIIKNIRRKLTQNNKVGTYLLYAFGEIVLVVLGILIAVSIDGKREENKEQAKVQMILKDIKNDLQADIDELSAHHLKMITVLSRFDSVKLRLQHDTSTVYTLKKIAQEDFNYAASTFPSLNDQTYNMIYSTGELSLIPDSLYRELKEYYDLNTKLRRDLSTFLHLYLVKISEHLGQFPVNSEYANYLHKSKLSSELWALSSEKEFLISFNELASNRRVYMADAKNYSKILAESAEEITEKFFLP